MIEINYTVIVLSSIVALILGFGWYGPLFGKMWARVIGMDASTMTPEAMKAMQKKMIPLYALQFLLSLLSMYVLYFIVKALPSTSGVLSAFWIWLGFVMPIQAGFAIWSGKPRKIAWQMFLLTAGYQLLCFLIAGGLIGGWN